MKSRILKNRYGGAFRVDKFMASGLNGCQCVNCEKVNRWCLSDAKHAVTVCVYTLHTGNVSSVRFDYATALDKELDILFDGELEPHTSDRVQWVRLLLIFILADIFDAFFRRKTWMIFRSVCQRLVNTVAFAANWAAAECISVFKHCDAPHRLIIR